jgi:hypothetical protein
MVAVLEMTTEIEKMAWSIAKRVIPVTEKEKTCINERGLKTIQRGHIQKAIIKAIKEKVNESEGATKVLDSPDKQAEPNY